MALYSIDSLLFKKDFMDFTTISPLSEKNINSYNYDSFLEAVAKIGQLAQGQKEWREQTVGERIHMLTAFASALEQNITAGAKLMEQEMGKLQSEGEAEIRKCLVLIKRYFENAEKWLKPEEHQVDGISHEIHFEPIGVLFSIMPWNFPYWQVLRFAIPTLLAGNTVLLKHADNVSGTANFLSNLFAQAGLSQLFTNTICTHETAAQIISHPLIRGVSFTGSARGGAAVAECAGKNLKKVILELGGSDPFIVLEDANIDRSVEAAAISRFMNAGQVCIAAKRLFVHQKIANEFIVKLQKKIAQIDMAPLVSASALCTLENQLQDALSQGASVLCGGKREKRPGFYFEPTLLRVENNNPSLKIISEEVFGPLAPIISFENIEQVIAMANDHELGLGASIWSENNAKAKQIAQRIEAGAIFINSLVKSEPLMPFGGIKKSGFGRELGRFGLLEFCNIKTYNCY